ncbi:MAG: hypothetical protein FWE88_00825 [Phycisphaerae bacterium]|nr:hypothetical protein [Phycisphaerae bacterium]
MIELLSARGRWLRALCFLSLFSGVVEKLDEMLQIFFWFRPGSSGYQFWHCLGWRLLQLGVWGGRAGGFPAIFFAGHGNFSEILLDSP